MNVVACLIDLMAALCIKKCYHVFSGRKIVGEVAAGSEVTLEDANPRECEARHRSTIAPPR